MGVACHFGWFGFKLAPMFIGHFGVGLAAKKVDPKLNLGLLFMACQFLDLLWPTLVLGGIEKVSVDLAATQVTPLDFSYYPFSHSFLMASVYSAFLGAVVSVLFKSRKSGVVVGLVVFSHWVLDWITHRPDLALGFGDSKVGLGLWNSLTGTLLVEGVIFVAGVFLYLKSANLQSTKKRMLFWGLILFLALFYVGNLFGPKPPLDLDPRMIAGPALAMWLIVLWGYFVDKKA
jgi:hypothetical protein